MIGLGNLRTQDCQHIRRRELLQLGACSALLDTYAAVPSPKLVIAVGACAISGGPFVDNPEVHNGCGSIVPVDLFIPGCPPHPMTILDGLLRLLGRLEETK